MWDTVGEWDEIAGMTMGGYSFISIPLRAVPIMHKSCTTASNYQVSNVEMHTGYRSHYTSHYIIRENIIHS
jgi:hypothetical protein